MKNFKIDKENLKEVYLISNTPLYLFKNFVRDESIQELKLNHTTEELVQEFDEISNQEIEEIDSLVYAYAIYISILLKNDSLTDSFIENEGNINFEWFTDLRNIYEEKITPTQSFNFLENLTTSSKKVSQKSEDNINDLELELA